MNHSTRFRMLRILGSCLWLFGALLLTGRPLQALNSGDILALDQGGGTNGMGQLLVVNPLTGVRSLLSDFGNPAQGDLRISTPASIAIDSSGRIFVDTLSSPSGGGALVQVDPQTGNRTLISDFGQGTVQGQVLYGLSVEPTRDGQDETASRLTENLLVNLATSFTSPFTSKIVRVDPATDNRVVVTDSSNPAQGPSLYRFSAMALEASGQILVGGDPSTSTCQAGIYLVDPQTGQRTLLSDFTNPAQGVTGIDLLNSFNMKWSAGEIFVSPHGVCSFGTLVVSIDSQTGNRAVVSDFSNSSQGTVANDITALGVGKSGDILAAARIGDTTYKFPALFRVDRATGARAVFSHANNPAQGPIFSPLVIDLAVVP